MNKYMEVILSCCALKFLFCGSKAVSCYRFVCNTSEPEAECVMLGEIEQGDVLAIIEGGRS